VNISCLLKYLGSTYLCRLRQFKGYKKETVGWGCVFQGLQERDWSNMRSILGGSGRRTSFGASGSGSSISGSENEKSVSRRSRRDSFEDVLKRRSKRDEADTLGKCKENSFNKGNASRVSEPESISELKSELVKAQHEAKLAAEIGQELLKQEQENSAEIERLTRQVHEQRVHLAELTDAKRDVLEEVAKGKDAMEETREECNMLSERNFQLQQKLEKLNRTSLDSDANISSLETTIDTLSTERDDLLEKVKILEARLQENLPDSQQSPAPSVTGSFSSTTDLFQTPIAPSHKPKNQDDESKSLNCDSDEDLLEELRTSNMGTAEDVISNLQEENSRNNSRIKFLEEMLRKKKLETQMSARKVVRLEESLSEYAQIVEANKDLGFNLAEEFAAESRNGEGDSSLEVVLLRDEIKRIQRELQDANVLAILHRDDFEETIDRLQEMRKEHLKGDTVTLKAGTRSDLRILIDAMVGSDEPIEVDDIWRSPLQEDATQEQEHEETRVVAAKGPDLDQLTGQLIAKMHRKRYLVFGASKSWKARIAEIHGPSILLFKNEWDKKSCQTVPIDGTEIRVIRRPHKNESTKTMSGKQRATILRASRIMHEFHVWHPRRPPVFFSAPNHVELSRWVEAIQRQSAKLSLQPKRFAAGYISVRTEKGWRRYFAVLRTDGLHLYMCARHRKSHRIVAIDSETELWKPQSPDQDEKLFLRSQEQGQTTLLADTPVDREWWFSTISAHKMGIVSVGSLEGMRNSTAFGCVDV